jgi:hypothetical protein
MPTERRSLSGPNTSCLDDLTQKNVREAILAYYDTERLKTLRAEAEELESTSPDGDFKELLWYNSIERNKLGLGKLIAFGYELLYPRD